MNQVNGHFLTRYPRQSLSSLLDGPGSARQGTGAAQAVLAWLSRRSTLMTLLFALSTILAGCNGITGPEVASQVKPMNGFGGQDLAARSSTNGNDTFGASPLPAAPGPIISRGGIAGAAQANASDFAENGASAVTGNVTLTPVESAGDYQLNFENAEATAVIKTVLGDVLQVNYVIDPRVNGQISLTSSRPVPRKSLIRLLESALSGINAVILKQNGLYRVVPAGDATTIQNVHYHEAGEGFGVTVIGMKNVPVALAGRVLEGLGSRGGSVRMEADSNLLIFQGTASERQAALDAASMVDVDWLKTRSVAILPLTNSAPDTVIAEVHRILGTGEGGLSKDIVQMQPINRLNAVLAVSRNHAAIDKVTRWVSKLDKADYAALGVNVYKLQYANAKNVAAMLNQIYGGSGGQTGQDQDKNVLQPGDSSSSSMQAGFSKSGSGSSQEPSSQSSNQSGSGRVTAGSLFANAGLRSSSANSNPYGSLSPATAAQTSGTRTDNTSSQAPDDRQSKVIRITPDISTNSLLIHANRLDYRLIERTIHAMDRPPVQVEIEVTVAEVTLTDALNYGVQAYLNSSAGSLQMLGSAGISNASIPLVTPHPAVNLMIGQIANPRVVINALSNITDVKVLSTPSLVVLDRQPAVLQVGNQVPILSQQATSTQTANPAIVNSVNYKDTGIILNVLPRVNANGVVALDIEQQISAVTNPDPTNLTPTISQRRVRSTIAIPNGQTVLLAGLIQETTNGTRSGLPIISKIRFLNDLVTNHNSSDSRTELIMFIKPQILRNGFDSQQVSEEFRERLQMMRSHP
ncbi:general secretion pathway protein D [Beijerinckia indica subsp. indica ATCC 9039]|uniref:General secretion pathway protein D n=2 Tax=Beijerinckia TaxID=532 RepID=B2IBK3_BEII9|nr:general secretion pathway protein D [Beijerinckia indica subsp. indica ATCC 9039]